IARPGFVPLIILDVEDAGRSALRGAFRHGDLLLGSDGRVSRRLLAVGGRVEETVRIVRGDRVLRRFGAAVEALGVCTRPTSCSHTLPHMKRPDGASETGGSG